MKRYYIGPKQVTIDNSDFFDGSVTLFKEKVTFEYWNPDTNSLQVSLFNSGIAKLTEPTEIMAYNPKLISECTLPPHVKQICKNPSLLLETFDNKNQTRRLLKNVVPMLDYHIIKGQDFDYKKLRNIANDLVVQLPVGSGGSKTYLVNRDNHEQIKSKLIPVEDYSISAYQYNNTSYNIHCMIGKDQIELFTPSKQELELSTIIEYIGNNFEIDIPNDVKSKLAQYSMAVCKKAQSMGYRGVLGIDYIYANNELYFIEINPRFQGSTRQVDGLLKKSKLPSIFDYNHRAFIDKEMPSTRKMERGIER